MKNRLKVCRVELNITQQQLADLLGITRQTIINIEKGLNVPRIDLGLRIAKIFNKSLEEIFKLD